MHAYIVTYALHLCVSFLYPPGLPPSHHCKKIYTESISSPHICLAKKKWFSVNNGPRETLYIFLLKVKGALLGPVFELEALSGILTSSLKPCVWPTSTSPSTLCTTTVRVSTSTSSSPISIPPCQPPCAPPYTDHPTLKDALCNPMKGVRRPMEMLAAQIFCRPCGHSFLHSHKEKKIPSANEMGKALCYMLNRKNLKRIKTQMDSYFIFCVYVCFLYLSFFCICLLFRGPRLKPFMDIHSSI